MQITVRRSGGARQVFRVLALLVTSMMFRTEAAVPVEDWTAIATDGSYLDGAAGMGMVVTVQPRVGIISWPHDNPTNRSTYPVSERANSIAYGGGRFVVATENALISSSNAVDWVRQPFAGDLSSTVAYGNRVFLVEGSNILKRSTDGFNWMTVTSPITNGPTALTFYAGEFLLWTSGGESYSSRDGLTWSPKPDGPTIFSRIAYGNGKYVAINSRREVLESTDAAHWKTNGILDILRAEIAWGNGYFVVVGGDGRAYSRDGVSWEINRNDITSYDVFFAYGKFISGAFEGLYQSGPVVNVAVRTSGEVAVYGVPGESYSIESIEALSTGADWESRHTFVMPLAEQYPWSDERPKETMRFYRVIPLP